jgi:PAS domain S-box-containing protein
MVHPPERREEAGRIVGEMLQGHSEFCPVPVLTKSGVQIPVETRVSHGIWDGKPVIFGVTKDISKVKLSEEKFSKLFHLNPSACGLNDLETLKYVEVNEAFYTLLGFDKDEVIGKTAIELGILPVEARNSIMIKADTNGIIINAEATLVAKNGDIKQVLLSAENIYVQDKEFRFTVVQDVTARKLAENAVQISETRYRRLFESAKDGILILDAESGMIKDVNPFLIEMLGYSKEEFIEKAIWEIGFFGDLVANKDKFIKLQQDEYVRYENLPLETAYGKTINVEFVSNVYLVDDRKVIQCNIRDITERRIADEALKKSEEALQKLNATKDKFFSIIAHDLKSPFNSIMGFSELLVEQVKNKDYNGIEKFAGIILNSSQRAVDLLMNLMEWSRSQTGRMEFIPEYFELVDFMGEILFMFDDIAGQKSIIIKKNLPSKIPVFADKAMINTVIRNLVSNAIKFTKTGGEIIITATEKQNEILVSVKDNGVGIPHSAVDKLFRIDENYTTSGTNKEQGTGLGLILCKEFIEKHGGKIWVESEEGKGSMFSFIIPTGK